jgi:serine/threonine-protein kinase HipA
MNDRCFYCYQILNAGDIDFHPQCSKKFFGTLTPPELPYSEEQMLDLALDVIRSRTTVPGVQKKLSLDIESGPTRNAPRRFTIVGLWGRYILKPPAAEFPQLPEVEDVTMHLAASAKIQTVPHSLIRMRSGNLAYITKRIDRTKNGKLQMEDMCQLTERLTEQKYQGSYEQIGKAILKYSDTPGLDTLNFAEQVMFSFLTGNADMHLKNFSLIDRPGIGSILAPAYDMVATKLVNPGDTEELALPLNGKKRKISLDDFYTFFTALGLGDKQQRNVVSKFTAAISGWMNLIERCFLSDEMKTAYKQLLAQRLDLLSANKSSASDDAWR